jgi:hypothetical protein
MGVSGYVSLMEYDGNIPILCACEGSLRSTDWDASPEASHSFPAKVKNILLLMVSFFVSILLSIIDVSLVSSDYE